MQDAQQTFFNFNLPEKLSASLRSMSFINPTPIQAKAIPAVLAGRDIVGCAQTGTGKTGAFAIPLITLLSKDPGAMALILAPTRELATQIAKFFNDVCRNQNVHGALLIGGSSYFQQMRQLQRGCNYIVATPGRLLDYMMQGKVRLNYTKYLVLDEFDRMLDMGFAPQLNKIVAALPKPRQTLLFSATNPAEIASKVNNFVKDPVRISIGPMNQQVATVKEKNVSIPDTNKGPHLLEQLSSLSGKTLIFTRTQVRVDRLAAALKKQGYNAGRLHGGCSMRQRILALQDFKRGHFDILVATDIAGRGIDVEDIRTVINYDLPATREDYIHRIGRTGRFGRSGVAINFVSRGEERQARAVTAANQKRA